MSFDPKSFALAMKSSGINTTAVKFVGNKADTVLSNGIDITSREKLFQIDEKREEFISTDLTPNIGTGGNHKRSISSRFD